MHASLQLQNGDAHQLQTITIDVPCSHHVSHITSVVKLSQSLHRLPLRLLQPLQRQRSPRYGVKQPHAPFTGRTLRISKSRKVKRSL